MWTRVGGDEIGPHRFDDVEFLHRPWLQMIFVTKLNDHENAELKSDGCGGGVLNFKSNRLLEQPGCSDSIIT